MKGFWFWFSVLTHLFFSIYSQNIKDKILLNEFYLWKAKFFFYSIKYSLPEIYDCLEWTRVRKWNIFGSRSLIKLMQIFSSQAEGKLFAKLLRKTVGIVAVLWMYYLRRRSFGCRKLVAKGVPKVRIILYCSFRALCLIVIFSVKALKLSNIALTSCLDIRFPLFWFLHVNY